jgi:hypothetical protein
VLKIQKPATPKSVPEGKEPLQIFVHSQLSPTIELSLVRQAVAANGAKAKILEESIQTKSRTIEITESNLAITKMPQPVPNPI